jgi:hypothetical protein
MGGNGVPTTLPEPARTPLWMRVLIWPLLWRFLIARIPTAILTMCLPLAHIPSCRPALGWLVRVTTSTGLWALRSSEDARVKRSAERGD